MIKRHVFSALVGSFLASAALLPSSSSSAATVSLNPVADTFVSSANPASNYGGAGALEVSAAGLPKGEFQSLLQFDLSSAKSSFNASFGAVLWSLQSVTLQFTATPPNNPLFNTSAAGQFAASWMQSDGWTEGTGTPASPASTGITWNSLPSFLSAADQSLGTFNFDGSTSSMSSYFLAVGSGVVADAMAGGLASLRLTAVDSTMSGLFDSRSFPTVASRPLLTLTAVAVPEPALWFLGILGFALLVISRRCLAR